MSSERMYDGCRKSADDRLNDASGGKRRRDRRGTRGRAVIKTVERALFVVAVCVLAWLGASSLYTEMQSRCTAPQSTSVARITVAPGDTIWKIAGTVGSPNVQQAQTVQEIRRLNPSVGQNQQLRAGQTIVVPVHRSEELTDLHLAKAY